MLNHKGTITLETERLILRCFSPDDADAMFNNLHTKTGNTIETVCDFFCKNWLESYSSLNSYQWVIVLKSLGEPIGTLRADMVDDLRRSLELGYEIGEKWWHQGIMTEAVRCAVQFFFEEVGLNRISARHNTTNPRSGGVLINIGMSREGVLRQASRTGCDVVLYAILAEDYFNGKASAASTAGNRNNLIIAGVPRAGKTTLCRMLMRHGYKYISMDAIIAGFEKCYPETGINTYQDLSSMETLHTVSGKIAPFIRAMIESEYSECEVDRAVFDVYQLLPADYIKHLASLDCVQAHWIGSSDCTEDERFDTLKANDTEQHYTFYKSESELREGCGYIVEQSRLLKRECEKYDLPYSDTTYNREAVLNAILAKLLQG